jgi:hypothetical protein
LTRGDFPTYSYYALGKEYPQIHLQVPLLPVITSRKKEREGTVVAGKNPRVGSENRNKEVDKSGYPELEYPRLK